MKTEKTFDVYRPFIPPHISPHAFQQHCLVSACRGQRDTRCKILGPLKLVENFSLLQWGQVHAEVKESDFSFSVFLIKKKPQKKTTEKEFWSENKNLWKKP